MHVQDQFQVLLRQHCFNNELHMCTVSHHDRVFCHQCAGLYGFPARTCIRTCRRFLETARASFVQQPVRTVGKMCLDLAIGVLRALFQKAPVRNIIMSVNSPWAGFEKSPRKKFRSTQPATFIFFAQTVEQTPVNMNSLVVTLKNCPKLAFRSLLFADLCASWIRLLLPS